jgi:high-affinity Fe2+/Pb2+ permease
MRPIRLARIAAEAEGVRLRGLVTRIVTRAIFAVVASIFLLGALTFGHFAAWYGIRVGLEQSFLVTTGILGGADLLVAIILLVLASRSTPSRTETEALEVRRRALEGIGSALSLTQMVLPVLRLVSGMRRRRRV